MNPQRIGNWRWAGVRVHSVYRVRQADLERVGYCWMKGRLLVDDLVMPIDQSGDCFFTYLLIEGGRMRGMSTVNAEGKHSYKAVAGVTFGAYALGTLHDEQPTEREYHLLRAGESTVFSDHIDVAEANAEAEEAKEREMNQALDRAVASIRTGSDGA